MIDSKSVGWGWIGSIPMMHLFRFPGNMTDVIVPQWRSTGIFILTDHVG